MLSCVGCSLLGDNHLFDNQIVTDILPGSFKKDSMAVYDIMRANGIPLSLFDTVITVNGAGRINELHLSSMSIKIIPESFCHLYALESLYLDSNLIERLPDSIGNLQQLRYFSIADNRLRSLPESIIDIKYIGYSYETGGCGQTWTVYVNLISVPIGRTVHRFKIKDDFLLFVKNSGVARFRMVEKSEKIKFQPKPHFKTTVTVDRLVKRGYEPMLTWYIKVIQSSLFLLIH